MRNVPPQLAGAASGLNNTIRQIGSVLGASVVGAVMQSRLTANLHTGAQTRAAELPPATRDGFVDAFSHGDTPDAGALKALAADLPAQTADRLTTLAGQVYDQGFVATMHASLVLPLSAVAVAAALCTLAHNHLSRKTAAAPAPATTEPEPSR